MSTSGRGSSLDRPDQVAQKHPVPEHGAELRAEKGGSVMYGEQSTGEVNLITLLVYPDSRSAVLCR
jgi:hypothetical protein